MAWAAIGAAEKAKETTAAEGITLDEEELLPQSSLATIRETFWKRYHWLPPPEQQPSDKLLSKLTRALQKRSLEVMNVFSVKTLFNQRSNPSTKRVKVAHNLWIGSTGDDEVQPVENWSTYLDQLLVYLIGLAMAGAYALQPPPTTPESLATESLQLCGVPAGPRLEIPLSSRPMCSTLSWECSPLCDFFTRSPRTSWMGTAFRQWEWPIRSCGAQGVERATHWSQVPLVTSEGGVSARPPEPALPPASKVPSAGVDQAFAEKLRDGTLLCQAWQRGKCPQQKERGCAQGQHRCARELNSGRVCGDPKHIGAKCSNKLRRQRWGSPEPVSPPLKKPGEQSTQGALEGFQKAVASMFDVWKSHVATNDDLPQIPVFLDLLAGPNYPLSQAFQWAGWKVVQPIDYQIDSDFDITKPAVQHAIIQLLPECHLVSAAMDCSTKSRIREIRFARSQSTSTTPKWSTSTRSAPPAWEGLAASCPRQCRQWFSIGHSALSGTGRLEGESQSQPTLGGSQWEVAISARRLVWISLR